MLLGVLISLGVRRDFISGLIHDFTTVVLGLFSAGCCDTSCHSHLEAVKNGCAVLSWVHIPPPAHTHGVHVWERTWMHGHIHTLEVFSISLNLVTSAKGDCWILSPEAQCVAIPNLPWLSASSLKLILILRQTSPYEDKVHSFLFWPGGPNGTHRSLVSSMAPALHLREAHLSLDIFHQLSYSHSAFSLTPRQYDWSAKPFTSSHSLEQRGCLLEWCPEYHLPLLNAYR